MLLHLLGIFDVNLLQHYLFLDDLQSFDCTCSKEPDQITVLCDVHQDEVFQCMYPQCSRSLLEHHGETHQPYFCVHKFSLGVFCPGGFGKGGFVWGVLVPEPITGMGRPMFWKPLCLLSTPEGLVTTNYQVTYIA